MANITIQKLQEKKTAQSLISALTCYDATFAKILDQHTTVDILLVGDSLGMAFKGEDSTLNVTIDNIAYHMRAVSKAAKRSHLIADMPFLSYQINEDETLKNAGVLMQAGAHAVKLEGGASLQNSIRRLANIGIPVMGHIGLTPQHIHALGGYVVQGKTKTAKDRLLNDALAIQDAGAYALVLECVPEEVAQEITARLHIPTIGIGAGKYCDGQILVLYDLLDLNPEFRPKFVKQFLDGAALIANACQTYVNEVNDKTFPEPKHTYHSKNTI